VRRRKLTAVQSVLVKGVTFRRLRIATYRLVVYCHPVSSRKMVKQLDARRNDGVPRKQLPRGSDVIDCRFRPVKGRGCARA
jgi:hypothetical protein